MEATKNVNDCSVSREIERAIMQNSSFQWDVLLNTVKDKIDEGKIPGLLKIFLKH